MINHEIKFLTCDDSVIVKNDDFKTFKYESKKKSEESVYDQAKRSYCERRGGKWRVPKPRLLRELESKLRDRSVVLCEWLSETIVVIVFSSGSIAYLTVNSDTLDLTQILFDRYCIGKLSGQSVTGVVFSSTHILFTHTDCSATLISFAKVVPLGVLSRISDRNPHVQNINLADGARRAERKVSWSTPHHQSAAPAPGPRVLVWTEAGAEPAPWSPAAEVRANLYLYQLHGQHMNVVAFHQLENETLLAEVLRTHSNIVHIVEQTTCHKNQKGQTNAAFEDAVPENYSTKRESQAHGENTKLPTTKDVEENQERAVWGNQIEFLLSCIATSVGLGNVWRFPFVAYQNGGGAFLVPYVIVLLVIGKPMYYLECALGQFSSRNSVRIWSLAPAMRGTGYAQAIGSSCMLSYYVAIIALCLFYLVQSFSSQLPWAVCAPEWGEACVPSGGGATPGPGAVSSAELYFTKTVVQLSDGIEGGLGAPIWYLVLCLLASWVTIFLIVVRGVKSSGKASYFLAIFPYFIMIILLVRSVTLNGASTGILFFLTPQWDKLLELSVWYAAVTQVFFSLGVATGAIIMFSSYNGFRQNIYRDAMIVTTLDTFTSLMSGITIFGILGNLAFELGYEDVDSVIGSGGTSLAFVSYPDAIAKSPFLPQLFSVLFFLMMCVLGVGSSVAVLSTITTLLTDAFPRASSSIVAAGCSTAGFLIGLVYVTPGGQYVLELVDYYGATFLILFAAIIEIIGVFWIYGLENVCLDIELMLGVTTSIYWRVCWGLVTPCLMIAVFVYSLLSFEPLIFGDDYVYPFAADVAGFTMLLVGIAVVPIFMITTLYKYRTGRFAETVKKAFSMKSTWGPRRADDRRDWLAFREEAEAERQKLGIRKLRHICLSLTGGYRRQTDI